MALNLDLFGRFNQELESELKESRFKTEESRFKIQELESELKESRFKIQELESELKESRGTGGHESSQNSTKRGSKFAISELSPKKEISELSPKKEINDTIGEDATGGGIVEQLSRLLLKGIQDATKRNQDQDQDQHRDRDRANRSKGEGGKSLGSGGSGGSVVILQAASRGSPDGAIFQDSFQDSSAYSSGYIKPSRSLAWHAYRP